MSMDMYSIPRANHIISQEINKRISQTWKKCWSLSLILLDKSQKMEIKGNIFIS